MSEDIALRDELARDRTRLANERTLLAYGRTTLGLVALAVFVFKFSSPEVAMIFGSLSLTAALFLFFWGLRSYHRIAIRINDAIQEPSSSSWRTLAARFIDIGSKEQI